MGGSTAVQMLLSGRDDLQWFEENLQTLKVNYNNRFIAFSNRVIVASDIYLEGLMKKLESKKVDRSEVFVRFISKIKTIL